MHWFKAQFGLAAQTSALKLDGKEIRDALSPRELRWLRRNALATARREPLAPILASFGLLVLSLLPFAHEAGRALGHLEAVMVVGDLLIGGGLLLGAGMRWWARYRWAMPGLLLRMNRCGCCGAGFALRGGQVPGNDRCAECGQGWSPLARVGPLDASLDREAA